MAWTDLFPILEPCKNTLREILKKISKSKYVEFAYPHTQVLLPDNEKII